MVVPLWFFLITATAAEQSLQIVRGDGVAVYFQVSEARTPAERARGLMFRQQLAARTGMWFDFEIQQRLSMWMKNTELPLDMLFVDRHGVIQHIHRTAIPHDLTPIRPPQPVRYVLELNAGDAERYRLSVGDRVVEPAP